MLRTVLFLAVSATPAFAQTVQEQAQEIIAASTASAGFAQDVSVAVAACFASRMSDAEAEALLAASDLAAQQVVVAEMADNSMALACAAEVMG